MKKKILKTLLSSAVCAIVYGFGMQSTAYAATTDIIVQDPNTHAYYAYSYDDLAVSLSGDKLLFNEFRNRTTISYVDSKNGFVNFDYIIDIYTNTDRKDFKLDQVTENAPADNIIKIDKEIRKRIQSIDGSLADNGIFKAGESDDLPEVIDIS